MSDTKEKFCSEMARATEPVILGIDPGCDRSGVVLYARDSRTVLAASPDMENHDVLDLIRFGRSWPLVTRAMERIEAIYGGIKGRHVVGSETVRTIMFCGRVIEAAHPNPVMCLSPAEIREAVCGTTRANDAAVTQALKDNIGKPGTKKAPGPTFGVVKHAWRALAAAHASTIAEVHTE